MLEEQAEKEFEEFKRDSMELLLPPFDEIDVEVAMRITWLVAWRKYGEEVEG